MRKPNPFRSLLLHSGFAVVADAIREDRRQPRFFSRGKYHFVITEGNRAELAFQNIVAGRVAGHRARAWESGIQLVAFSAAESLRFDNAFAGGRPAGIDQVGGLGAQNLV